MILVNEMTKAEQKRFEELCELKLKVVEERNEIVMQTEEERVRELEEDVTTNTMLDKQFGANDGEETSSDEGNINQAKQADLTFKFPVWEAKKN